MPTERAPLLFVNKDAFSSTLSHSRGDTKNAIFRHVQEHIRHQTSSNKEAEVKSAASRISRLPSKVTKGTRLRQPTRKEYAPRQQSSDDDIYQTNSEEKIIDDFQRIATSIALKSNTGVNSRAAHKKSPPLYLGHGLSKQVFPQTLELYPSLCLKDKSVDPFDVSSLPITRITHHFLTYFESLFFSQTVLQPASSSRFQSAGHQVVKDCISDHLQMKCVLAAMAVRRETFDSQSIEGGSANYISQAVLALQSRLKKSSVIDSKLMYSVMKLYEAEAFRSNLEGALIHLHGAQCIAQEIDLWKDLDQSYTATLCGSEQAYFLAKVWSTPREFPVFADPGPAMSCFSGDLMQDYLMGDRPHDGTGRILQESLLMHNGAAKAATDLHQIIVDLIEYSSVRRNMLLQEHTGLPIPAVVSQWAYLRRYALVFRLMSVSIIESDFLHAIRVALVIWLSVVANYTAFDRNLQIVATHLQEVMARLLPYEELGAPEAVVWMLMLGASCGDVQYSRPWFICQLSDFSRPIDPYAERGVEEWFNCLESSSQKCLYCELIQKQSLVDIARKMLLERLQ